MYIPRWALFLLTFVGATLFGWAVRMAVDDDGAPPVAGPESTVAAPAPQRATTPRAAAPAVRERRPRPAPASAPAPPAPAPTPIYVPVYIPVYLPANTGDAGVTGATAPARARPRAPEPAPVAEQPAPPPREPEPVAYEPESEPEPEAIAYEPEPVAYEPEPEPVAERPSPSPEPTRPTPNRSSTPSREEPTPEQPPRRATDPVRKPPRPTQRPDDQRSRLAAPPPAAGTFTPPTSIMTINANGDGIVIAADGAIVAVGDHPTVTGNTGDTSASGIIAVDAHDSAVISGNSERTTVEQASPPSAPSVAATETGAEARSGDTDPAPAPGTKNRSGGGRRAVAIAGIENHSVDVGGDENVVTYDDSNVALDRNGRVNGNTGDTDTSGLNVVDDEGSAIRSGDSGNSDEAPDDPPFAASSAGPPAESDGRRESSGQSVPEKDSSARPPAESNGRRESSGQSVPEKDSSARPPAESDGRRESSGQSVPEKDSSARPPAESDGQGDASRPSAAVATSSPRPLPEANGRQGGSQPSASVADVNGVSTATADDSLVVGGDGIDDNGVTVRGRRNVVTYDDGNVAVGGTGDVNSQIGDSDTGGAVTIGTRGSHIRAGDSFLPARQQAGAQRPDPFDGDDPDVGRD
jgi:hypothetical protein